MMIKVSEPKIQDRQASFTLSKSFVPPQGEITKKNSLDKSTLFSVIGLGLMFIWVLTTYLFTPQLMRQVLPAALIISTILFLKSSESKPSSFKK